MGIGRTIFAAIAGLMLCCGGAFAQTAPGAKPVDPRIRTLIYDAGQVVTLRGFLGYQMMIAFDPEERIENVSIGDSLGWQVTPNRRATLLFLKPIEARAATNMTVVTTLRRYAFELRAGEANGPNDPNIVYELRFTYLDRPAPAPATAAPKAEEAPARDLNFSYASKGSKGMTPARVFDDGRFTYFEFPDGLDAPAIFVIGPTGQEELVNNQTRGRYNVVDVVARQFILRYGKGKTTVTNEAYVTPGFAAGPPEAPK
jgi:type IV secretion system protein VirB9